MGMCLVFSCALSCRMEYVIRPKEEKHPSLLPGGQEAEFRIEKDHMRVRVPEMDNREREFTVVSMSQRTDLDNSAPEKAEVKAEK